MQAVIAVDDEPRQPCVVESGVEPGEILPEQVHTPGVFVQRVLALTPEQAADKKIEKRTVRPRPVDVPGAGVGSEGGDL